MPIHPEALAEARRIVGRPDARTPIALVQNAWATLKAERGQSVDFRILGDAHHISDETLFHRANPAGVTTAAELEAMRRAALPRIRSAVEALGCSPTGGDAA